MKALDMVAKAIGTQKCVVHVTGYSSTEGDYAHNALFSIERSQNALHYLAERGVKFRKYSANGVGETTQFGPNPAANRRVVVAVSP
jgi:outer membrane protein OmpA-like peptidoglycan-associated protein